MNVGYYRLKVIGANDRTVNLYINGQLACTKEIIVENPCEPKILKFIDSKGQYKFVSFNRFWESKDKAKLIGVTSSIIESLLTSQSNERAIGYNNERTLSLVSDETDQTKLLLLSELYISPLVYLYVGNGEDEDKDWIIVSVTAKNAVNRIRKGNYARIEVDVTLPEHYTIKRI